MDNKDNFDGAEEGVAAENNVKGNNDRIFKTLMEKVVEMSKDNN